MVVPLAMRERIPMTDRTIRLASMIQPSAIKQFSMVVPIILDAGNNRARV